MDNKQLWYTRRGREIRGPFPPGLITRYILLGRVHESDELSTDQISWHLVSELPDLIPQEMKQDLSIPKNMERLQIARLREDEREAGDRREKQAARLYNSNYTARGEDRRGAESPEVLHHREIKTRLLESLRKQHRHNHMQRIVGLMLVLAMMIWFAFFLV